jgi:hypothetical protein
MELLASYCYYYELCLLVAIDKVMILPGVAMSSSAVATRLNNPHHVVSHNNCQWLSMVINGCRWLLMVVNGC